MGILFQCLWIPIEFLILGVLVCITTIPTVEAKTHHYKSEDCVKKLVSAINGRTPGPTILAQQGDTVVVELKNSLPAENVTIVIKARQGSATVMAPFLRKFFPSVLRKMRAAQKNDYCVYDSQLLTSFNSLLYIAGFAASLMASHITRAMGHRATMVLGGCIFLMGAAINSAAVNIEMLILGRILLGLSFGLMNQVTPVYLSEMAPPKWRDAFNMGFQFFMVAANVLSYGLARPKWGWRLSLILPAVPAAIMTLGALLISLTSSNLAEQSRSPVRAVKDMEARSNDPVESREAAKAANEEPLKTIFERKYRPFLVMAVAIPLFQQLTGINIIALYAPILLQTIGFGNSALIASIILGLVSLGSLLLSICIVDRFGRRVLFMEGGIQMIIFQVAVACVLGTQIGVSGDEPLSRNYVILVLALMCIYAAGFGWSWGPLSWLILSEIFPMEIRPACQSISFAVYFATTSVLAQTFLTMLCHFKYGTFLFYAGWIAMMTIFVDLFLPETKGVPLESMHTVWEHHWYWRRFVKQAPPANELSALNPSL